MQANKPWDVKSALMEAERCHCVKRRRWQKEESFTFGSEAKSARKAQLYVGHLLGAKRLFGETAVQQNSCFVEMAVQRNGYSAKRLFSETAVWRKWLRSLPQTYGSVLLKNLGNGPVPQNFLEPQDNTAVRLTEVLIGMHCIHSNEYVEMTY